MRTSSRWITGFAMSFALAGSATAMPLEELKKYDLNGNGCIDAGREESIYLSHLANPILRAFDQHPISGSLDAQELKDLQAFKTRNGQPPKLHPAASETGIDEALLDLQAARCNLAALADKPKPAAAKDKAAQRLFLRKNRLEVSIYNQSIESKAAEGANVSFAVDNRLRQHSVGLEGYLSYVLKRERFVKPPENIGPRDMYLSGYAIAPFFQFNRVITGGKNAPAETDKLTFGADTQFELFSGPIFGNQVVTFAPYLQTDTMSASRIFGGRATWEPYNTEWNVGLGERRPLFPGLEFTWQFHADLDYRFVDRPGNTGLKLHDDFMWTGAGVRATFWILPDLFDSKLYVVVSPSYYRDVQQSRTATLIDTSLNYNLDTQGLSALKVSYRKGYDIQLDKQYDLITGSIGVKF